MNQMTVNGFDEYASYSDRIAASIEALTADDIRSLIQRADRPEQINQFNLLAMAKQPPQDDAIEYLQEAAIATKLSGRLNDAGLCCGSVLRVVGSDRPSLTEPGYPWRNDLAGWLRRGVEIRLLLINPSDEIIKVLVDLKDEVPDSALSAWKARVDFNANEDGDADYILLKELESTHFVTGADPTLLWFESLHRRGSLLAEDCWFYSPASSYGRALSKQFSALFDRLIETREQVQSIDLS